MNRIKNLRELILITLLIMPLIAMSSCGKNEKGSSLVIKASEGDEEACEATNYAEICIYIVGEVVNPGVYMLRENSRVCDAIEVAGGFTEQAAKDYLNLAGRISDGEKIIVYSMEQVNEQMIIEKQSSLININTASIDKLMTLPGIGESRAKDIIKYREKNGRFEAIEDIMKVSGIKEAAFSKIEDLITVN